MKGMVLVDSTHEQTVQRMPPAPSNKENLDNLMRRYYLAQFGWLRLSGAKLPYARAPLSPEDRNRLVAFFLKSKSTQIKLFFPLRDQSMVSRARALVGIVWPIENDVWAATGNGFTPN